MSKLHQVTDATFESEVLKSTQPVLVEFSATWCGPCKSLATTLEALEPEYSGRMKFVTVDIDASQATSMKYRVMSVPTMIVFKGGEVVAQVAANRPRAEVASFLDGALAR